MTAIKETAPFTAVGIVETTCPFPKAVEADEAGNIYAGCCGGQGGIEKYTPDGSPVWMHRIGRVKGLTISSQGTVLASVGRKKVNTVYEFGSQGKVLNIIEDESLFNVQGIAGADNGNMYIAQTSKWSNDSVRDGNVIMMFSRGGQLIHQWGETGAEPGELNLPVGIAVRFGKLFVTDSYNSRIQVYSTEGDFLYGWGVYGTSEGEFNCPQGIAVNEDRTVYIADTYNNRIQVFETNGKFLHAFGTQGEEEDEFWLPCGVAVRDDKIYVADTMNNRISIIRKEN